MDWKCIIILRSDVSPILVTVLQFVPVIAPAAGLVSCKPQHYRVAT